ncbi:Cof-type HAD-IIB family hydrolase [Streptococcus didelphis]|uniref:Cof-type HAD-IIB family hydrolase n=1 Tax=Streptococcus didelphis TaxID=102886 RepID=UPI00036D9F47|nr:Cof-type HAD-IIB family hydrolase [Streptococcus didelphis]
MIKLIATDMDGTFLKEDGTYSKKRLVRVLEALKQKGIVFAVSSGRSLLAIDSLFADFLGDIAVIAENGSLVKYQDQVLFADYLTKTQCQEIIEAILINPFYEEAGILLSGQKAAYILEGASQAYIEKMHHYYENIKLIANIDAIGDDLIFKLTTTFTNETVLKASDWLDQRLAFVTAVTTGFESIDIILKEVNKGFGMEHLCKALAILPEQVLAFGDNFNDIQMLEYAGLAIAPENAREEIKAIVDQVIEPCQQESVLTYLERFVENE